MTNQGSAARRRLILGYVTAGVLGAALVAAIVAVAVSGDGGGSTEAPDDPFGPHFEGLEQRRVAAGVPTMAEGGGEHFHPEIAVYVNGEPVRVPASIGIDPTQPPTAMAGLHTHDESGTIHNEAGTGSTLGQFFEIWGVPFSRTQLGPYEARRDQEVRMWVNGEPSQAFEDLALADGQQIVVAYGSKDEAPEGFEP